ncbi:RNA polymerase sigma-70 factor (family 1) [Pedobacter africanus]|uniref:RNA polymerase sigma-70 factor (ECF subfamily) n=1 Tax=Pedobacter africanus TaxID=151894 RepID=A0ACC6KRT7_9SPHI|nr:sigma-70 family RNA polymerase sigma factor [Pedobacter africanus]MDR6782065.1 RNA polymerase sigma-70 factor (ECF subfamily) [Pedobacter africanus]
MAEGKSTTNKSTLIDRKTFETIYNLYWEKVYAVCYNNIREIEPAREMVQDIFKSLWERRLQLELENVNNYLIRSAKFKTFEYIRNKTNQQKHICIKYQDCSHSSNCTEERVLFNNLKEKVNILVDTLPCQCRRVYKMSREQGLSNKEIASALLITERAVEYHITRALSVLRLKLSNYSD